MKRYFCVLLAAAALALVALPAHAAEATFERDLSVTGRVDLTIEDGSGYIHLSTGPAGRVHVFARVKSGWGVSDSQVQQVADHPPIEQTGSIIRIGQHHDSFHNIGIDYDIEAPADSFLHASSGSEPGRAISMPSKREPATWKRRPAPAPSSSKICTAACTRKPVRAA